MRKLAQHGDRTYAATDSKSLASALDSFRGEPFVCLLWDHDGSKDEPERRSIARKLILAGCRWLVLGGKNARKWHIEADLEFAALHDDKTGQEYDAVHVMTTGEGDDPPDELAWEFVFTTAVEPEAKHFLVVNVGSSEDEKKLDAAILVHAADWAQPGRSSRDN